MKTPTPRESIHAGAAVLSTLRLIASRIAPPTFAFDALSANKNKKFRFSMSAPSGIGCVETANVRRERAGANFKDLFSVHGSKSPFFAIF